MLGRTWASLGDWSLNVSMQWCSVRSSISCFIRTRAVFRDHCWRPRWVVCERAADTNKPVYTLTGRFIRNSMSNQTLNLQHKIPPCPPRTGTWGYAEHRLKLIQAWRMKAGKRPGDVLLLLKHLVPGTNQGPQSWEKKKKNPDKVTAVKMAGVFNLRETDRASQRGCAEGAGALLTGFHSRHFCSQSAAAIFKSAHLWKAFPLALFLVTARFPKSGEKSSKKAPNEFTRYIQTNQAKQTWRTWRSAGGKISRIFALSKYEKYIHSLP